jgi:hypothetical protein
MKLRLPSPIGLMLLMAACVDPPAPNYQAPNPVYYAPQTPAPPPTPTFSANAASLLLKQGMSEEAVVSALGTQPISAELGTCGSKTRQPWQCKTWRYRDSPYGLGGRDLFIWFGEINGVWYVNNWSVL